MNEKQTASVAVVRPTKKQRELLQFIDAFIKEHGYSPSYREIMVGLNYTSVATVALHVNNLMKRGHLRKRDHSARSLEVMNADTVPAATADRGAPSDEKWLVGKVEHAFAQAEASDDLTPQQMQDLQTLLDTLRILEFGSEAQSFVSRLETLHERCQVDNAV